MTTIKTGKKVNKGVRLSTERYKELVGRYDKYIKSNSASISSNYTNLYSNYIASILNTDYILLTI